MYPILTTPAIPSHPVPDCSIPEQSNRADREYHHAQSKKETAVVICATSFMADEMEADLPDAACGWCAAALLVHIDMCRVQPRGRSHGSNQASESNYVP